jgi:hypothetical protein
MVPDCRSRIVSIGSRAAPRNSRKTSCHQDFQNRTLDSAPCKFSPLARYLPTAIRRGADRACYRGRVRGVSRERTSHSALRACRAPGPTPVASARRSRRSKQGARQIRGILHARDLPRDLSGMRPRIKNVLSALQYSGGTALISWL